MKSVEQQIKDVMAKKVIGQTTEIYKGVVLDKARQNYLGHLSGSCRT